MNLEITNHGVDENGMHVTLSNGVTWHLLNGIEGGMYRDHVQAVNGFEAADVQHELKLVTSLLHFGPTEEAGSAEGSPERDSEEERAPGPDFRVGAEWWADRASRLRAEDDALAAATLAGAIATLALVEQQRIANLIALEQVRTERTNAGGNYYGPSIIWGNPTSEYGSAPLYDDIAIGLGVDRG